MADILIIGAGAAGLAAGRRLTDDGLSVTVLEARDRIGGRIHTDTTVAEYPVELGAEFIHGERASTHVLVNQYSLRALAAPRKPQMRWGIGQAAAPLAALDPDFQKLLERLSAAYAQIAQRFAPGADDQPLEAYLRAAGFDEPALKIADVMLGQTWCAPLGALSCQDIAHEMRTFSAGKQEFRIEGGYASLLNQWSVGLDIKLGVTVEEISWRANDVRLRTSHGDWEAARCIITVPVSVLAAARIHFSPALPAPKQAAIAAFRTTAATKLIYHFDAPQWDPDLVYMLHTGTTARWWTSAYGYANGRTLCTYVTADRAGLLDAMPEEDALALGLQELEGLLATTGLSVRVVHMRRVAWAQDPLALGGYAYVPAGYSGIRQTLAEPVDNVLFFAGEATAHHSNPQTVHGALDSGQRAAKEVLKAFGYAPPPD